MKKRGWLCLVFILVLWVGAAWTQEKVEAPVWNIGDQWTFKRVDGQTFFQEVVDVKEDLFIVKVGGERDLSAYDKKTLNIKYIIEESGRQLKSTSNRRRLFDFPISVGKKWVDTTTAVPVGGRTEVTYVNEFKIEGVEEVTTPAGTFKAYKIYYNQKNMASGNTGWVLYWYASDAKMWVKREAEKTDLWVRVGWAQNAELVSYRIK